MEEGLDTLVGRKMRVRPSQLGATIDEHSRTLAKKGTGNLRSSDITGGDGLPNPPVLTIIRFAQFFAG